MLNFPLMFLFNGKINSNFHIFRNGYLKMHICKTIQRLMSHCIFIVIICSYNILLINFYKFYGSLDALTILVFPVITTFSM